MKLVVPELAPSLGRLIVPSRSGTQWLPLDDLREALVTRVIDSAGAARRDAADDAPARALARLGREIWNGHWEDAVRRVAERVAAALDVEIERSGLGVRMPVRRRRLLSVSVAERRAIAARLASGGDGFEAALNTVARATDALHRHWPGDAATRREWDEAQLLAARRLEAAWLTLEAQVESERSRWEPELGAIRAWRPSLWPVFAVWTPLAGLTLWLGLVLGGYLPAPAWLAELLGF